VSLLSTEIELKQEWDMGTFSGYAIHTPAGFDTSLIEARAEVKYVEANQLSFISTFKNSTVPSHVSAAACLNQLDVPSWGLTRTQEHIKSLNGMYHHYEDAGASVIGYVIDTGIYVQHPKFAGRATWGVDTADKPPVFQDGNGHGTHVAGTMIADTFGLARAGTAIAVKVLGSNGSGTNDGVIAGINWAFKDHKTRGVGRSVVNMSLGGGLSQAINDAVAAAVRGGMIFVVAAGNDGRGIIPSPDACKHSPASEPLAVTVGATDSTDYRADYSNYGKCVKIWAPGSAITSLWKQTAGQKEPINTISGTSMASPHVAGVAMKLWSLHPTATGKEITDLMYDSTTDGLLKGVTEKNSPNKLVYQSCA
jgi:subtilisin family serine protease